MTFGTCRTWAPAVRSSHAIDDRLLAPGATTAVLDAVLALRTLLTWLTGPYAPWGTFVLVMVRKVWFVVSSGRPYR